MLRKNLRVLDLDDPALLAELKRDLKAAFARLSDATQQERIAVRQVVATYVGGKAVYERK